MSDKATNLQITGSTVRQLQERRFWASVQQYFERAASDLVDSEYQRSEVALWEKATQQDLKGEQW